VEEAELPLWNCGRSCNQPGPTQQHIVSGESRAQAVPCESTLQPLEASPWGSALFSDDEFVSQVEACVLKIAEEIHVVIQEVRPLLAEKHQGIVAATIKARQRSQDAPQMVDVARQMRGQREE